MSTERDERPYRHDGDKAGLVPPDPPERDETAEALGAELFLSKERGSLSSCTAIAELILASDWLARDRAASEARGAAAVLRDAANRPDVEYEWEKQGRSGIAKAVSVSSLRDRAAQIGADRSEPSYIDIVFDGPPSHVSGRFVEVENPAGASIRVGEWIDRGDGFWALRIGADQ